jgi:hypothetical protein
MTIQGAYLLRIASLFLLFLLSPYSYSSETWHPPSGDWTQQDLNRLLHESPWSLQVEATMEDPADVREETQAPLPGAAEAGMAGTGVQDGKPRWDGGIGKSRMGHLATIPVLVRWDSAHIIQEALKRSQTDFVPDARARFVITVIGLLPAGHAGSLTAAQASSSSDADTPPLPKSTQENLEWFMANSQLIAKGQKAENPLNVKIDPKTGAVYLFFARTDAVLAHKRDVLFVTRYGAMHVQARFRTKDMRVDGQPDL